MQRLHENIPSQPLGKADTPKYLGTAITLAVVLALTAIIVMQNVAIESYKSQPLPMMNISKPCEFDICSTTLGPKEACMGMEVTNCKVLEDKCTDTPYMKQWKFINCTFLNNTCNCYQS